MLWVNLGVKGSRVQILSARPTLTQVTAEADVERQAIEPPRQGRMTASLDAHSLAMIGPDERVAAVRRQRGWAPRRR
jgi:hypothetical protein